MHGRIWILGGVGVGSAIQSYNIETGEWEQFPGDPGNTADHMQAVAFENELWWMGGRGDSLTSQNVMIWNPVSRQWREGPDMFYPRSGFAAVVAQGQIMVAGGERIDSFPGQLIVTMEIYAPGAETWAEGPQPPVAVHGTTGSTVDGQLVLTAGSDIAGSLSLNRATQIYSPGQLQNR
jgi:N-acetylneuraminic acid mutarotase